jgi:hypothetical protein
LWVVAVVLLSVNNDGVADAFCPSGKNFQGTCRHFQPSVGESLGQKLNPSNSVSTHRAPGHFASSTGTRMFLVSEEDVLEAVERAEALWAEALEARKTANALIDRAEEEANASAGTAKEAENIFQDKTTPITMQELVQVDSAAKASLDATSLVNKAMDASDEAWYDTAFLLAYIWSI